MVMNLILKLRKLLLICLPYNIYLTSFGNYDKYDVKICKTIIFTTVIFPSFNHRNILISIPDEHSHKVVCQLVKSHWQ